MPMSVHRIHLREPWPCEVGREAVCWRRRFNQPTGLGSRERVWLVLEGLPGHGEVHLNSAFLGQVEPSAPASRFDITGYLQPHNELVLLVSSQASLPGRFPAQATLEIVG